MIVSKLLFLEKGGTKECVESLEYLEAGVKRKKWM